MYITTSVAENLVHPTIEYFIIRPLILAINMQNKALDPPLLDKKAEENFEKYVAGVCKHLHGLQVRSGHIPKNEVMLSDRRAHV